MSPLTQIFCVVHQFGRIHRCSPRNNPSFSVKEKQRHVSENVFCSSWSASFSDMNNRTEYIWEILVLRSCHIATHWKLQSRSSAANMVSLGLGDSPQTGAARMAVHMVSEKKPSSGVKAGKEHNSQLSRQIEGNCCWERFVWQVGLLRPARRATGPLCPPASHKRFRSRQRSLGGFCARLPPKGLSDGGSSPWWEGFGGCGCGAAVSWVLDCVFTSRRGRPTVRAKGRGKSAGHASVNSEPDLNAQRDECGVSSRRIFRQTESVIILMRHWWDEPVALCRHTVPCTCQCVACCAVSDRR